MPSAGAQAVIGNCGLADKKGALRTASRSNAGGSAIYDRSMIGIGLVGFGFAGRVFHAPIISAVPGLRLRAILQRSGRDAAGCYPGVAAVKSMDDLLAIDEIRVVVIATPNTSHHALAKQCLLAGRDVVVDKPFTATYA